MTGKTWRVGMAEIFYLLGLLLLAAGVFWVFGAGWSLIVAGVLLISTAFYNDHNMNNTRNS
jgi:hypothetical protein